MNPLPYNFGEGTVENRVAIMVGYMQALQHVFSYLQSETKYDPANCQTAVINLVEKIGVTSAEIAKLQIEYQTELSLLQLFQK